MNKSLSIDTVCKVLCDEGFLIEAQIPKIRERAAEEREKLIQLKKRELSHHKSRGGYDYEIPAVEIIASFNFKTDKTGVILTEEFITKVLAKQFGIPYKKIDPLELDSNAIVRLLPKAFAKRHVVLGLAVENNQLHVAMANPLDHEVLEDLRRHTKFEIVPCMTPRSDLIKIINEFYGFRYSISAAAQELAPQIDLGNLEQYVKLKSAKEIEATDKHVVNAVDYLLSYAFDQRASDIHLEPKRDFSLTRFRIDGVLHNVHTMPKVVHNAVVSRIKMLSRMNIAEKRRPQDGRIKTEFKGREVELRVSMLPVAFGEKAVVRIFDPDILIQNLANLGFFPRELELLESFIQEPHGIILVTGPTGSGKTTTLYSALRKLSSPDVNIITIEDPIEMIYEEFNQIGVQPQIDFSFAAAIRTILRQDPDIIMVGEIRDYETLENAIQAALTGHLVLSTLHTNDAPSSITRLLDLGAPPFLINSTIIGIIAQRLVRRVCSYCAKPYDLSAEEQGILGLNIPAESRGKIQIGEGCDKCRWTGYLGRTGIFEIMEMNDRVRKLITQKTENRQIKTEALKDGMITLHEGAIRKMLNGETTVSEVLRVTGVGEDLIS